MFLQNQRFIESKSFKWRTRVKHLKYGYWNLFRRHCERCHVPRRVVLVRPLLEWVEYHSGFLLRPFSFFGSLRKTNEQLDDMWKLGWCVPFGRREQISAGFYELFSRIISFASSANHVFINVEENLNILLCGEEEIGCLLIGLELRSASISQRRNIRAADKVKCIPHGQVSSICIRWKALLHKNESLINSWHKIPASCVWSDFRAFGLSKTGARVLPFGR